jgi:outer membrane protein OmpA-like peptidoglycan-associated protein
MNLLVRAYRLNTDGILVMLPSRCNDIMEKVLICLDRDFRSIVKKAHPIKYFFMNLISNITALICTFLGVAAGYSQELMETKRVDSIAVFFKSGSFDVEDAQKLLARLNAVKANTGKVRMISYTDTVGSLSANQKLAAKRLSALSKIVRTSNLNTFIFDSINRNELRTGRRKLTDSVFRRVDVIVYSVENKFAFNTPINLNINFESATDIIVPGSTENLETVLSILQKDSTLRIQLNGHVCCRPSHELSVQRAERVKKYLVSNGVKANRITCKGFSNTVPVVSNANIEEQRKNMRVEVVFRK